MTRMQVKIGMSIYILLSTIEPTEVGGKRGRKAISKTIKKKLLIWASKNQEEYQKLLDEAELNLKCTKDNLVAIAGENAMFIDPAILLKTLKKKYPKYIDVFELKDDHINNMYDAYKDNGLTFNTVRYTNQLVKQLEWEAPEWEE